MNRLARIWQAIRWWRGWQGITLARVVVLLMVVAAVMSVFREYGGDLPTIRQHLFDNIATEVISVGLTVLVIDWLNERRAKAERKEAIIAQIGSRSNDFALDAARIARKEQWLRDGALKNRDLWKANLQGAELVNANLGGIHLEGANLQDVDLTYADLQGAHLMGADLRGARLWYANLRGANLRAAKLQGVQLEGTLLQDTYLGDTKLPGSFSLGSPYFDEETTLPDNTKWSTDTDMTLFTNPEHPESWPPDNPNSPAYRGKKEPD